MGRSQPFRVQSQNGFFFCLPLPLVQRKHSLPDQTIFILHLKKVFVNIHLSVWLLPCIFFPFHLRSQWEIDLSSLTLALTFFFLETPIVSFISFPHNYLYPLLFDRFSEFFWMFFFSKYYERMIIYMWRIDPYIRSHFFLLPRNKKWTSLSCVSSSLSGCLLLSARLAIPLKELVVSTFKMEWIWNMNMWDMCGLVGAKFRQETWPQ